MADRSIIEGIQEGGAANRMFFRGATTQNEGGEGGISISISLRSR